MSELHGGGSIRALPICCYKSGRLRAVAQIIYTGGAGDCVFPPIEECIYFNSQTCAYIGIDAVGNGSVYMCKFGVSAYIVAPIDLSKVHIYLRLARFEQSAYICAAIDLRKVHIFFFASQKKIKTQSKLFAVLYRRSYCTVL